MLEQGKDSGQFEIVTKVGFGWLFWIQASHKHWWERKKVIVKILPSFGKLETLQLWSWPISSAKHRQNLDTPRFRVNVQTPYSILICLSGAQGCCTNDSSFRFSLSVGCALMGPELPLPPHSFFPLLGPGAHCQITTASCVGALSVDSSEPEPACIPRASEHSSSHICALLSEGEKGCSLGHPTGMEPQCPVTYHLQVLPLSTGPSLWEPAPNQANQVKGKKPQVSAPSI